MRAAITRVRRQALEDPWRLASFGEPGEEHLPGAAGFVVIEDATGVPSGRNEVQWIYPAWYSG